MTGRPLFGLLAALLVEGRCWTRTRWDFDDSACARVWQFTAMGMALAAVLIWLDGNRYTALPILLSWLPLLLLPVQFIQSYGLRPTLPLSAFSFLARRRHRRNLRLGLVEETPHFNFGNVLFAVTMVSATVGSNSSSAMFLPGMVVLVGWMLVSSGRGRWTIVAPLLLLIGLTAMGGRFLLEQTEDWLGRAGGGGRSEFDPNFTSTLIGVTGVVRQSPEIVWRLQPAPGNLPPRLLRTASFNTYLGSSWRNPAGGVADFRDLDTRLIRGEPYHLLADSWIEKDPSRLPAFTLRGAANAKTPLVLPGDAAALRGFALDAAELNDYGTVRIFPKHPVIEGEVFWHGGSQPESLPVLKEDLRIPVAERPIIAGVAEELGLCGEMPLAERLAMLRRFFQREFRYTRRLTIRYPAYRADAGTAISDFLTRVRAGHCEYFATAAVLLLREAGVPARYTTGYMLMEHDSKSGGFVVRGTHGHAWCRVWDADTAAWRDFDPTPPDPRAAVGPDLSLSQRLGDQIKRLREDFFLWRNRPENRLAISSTMIGIGLLLAVFITHRLWGSRRTLAATPAVPGYPGNARRTPLHELETRARRHLGERPAGLTFSGWLLGLQTILPEPGQLLEAIAIHQRLRFDPAPPDPEDRQRLRDLTAELGLQLKAAPKRRG